MRNLNKWISLALALMLCVCAASAVAETAAYTEAPMLTDAGVYGDVKDRLPKEPMVEDADYLT
ncbi:MAG: hypothetical protein PUD63_12360, partial [Clostridia bacterium]|nr:hypothetical protein [Clostridia bacterium]